MSLREYNRKRKFSQTPEPRGKEKKKGKGNLRFVVQMHNASRLHFDLRLEFDGSFKSWAVPKGPSLNPLDQRLAVFVEDHPLDYGSFEGIIPKGNYGAGTVLIWDEGTYVERGSKGRNDSEAAMIKNLEKGHLTFVLDGHKLKGEFALIKLKNDPGEKSWLLVKKRDTYSTYKRTQIPDNLSVKTGRTIEEISQQAEAAGNIWLPKKKKQNLAALKVKASKRSEPKSQTAPSKEDKSVMDPIPRKNKPMQASASRTQVTGPEWIFESDNKGLRTLAEVEGKRVHIYSRSGLPFNNKFPQIVEELKKLNLTAVFDGEILQHSKKAIYSVFDLLYAEGKDLRKKPLYERKKVLERVLPVGPLVFPSSKMKAVKTKNIIAKNKESQYRSGISSDWLIFSTDALQNTEEARLTNQDKIYWPNEGITKGDLLNYYKSIASFILPYLKDRPESLNRQPNGITAPGFYQKDLTGHIPRWLKTERIFSESAGKSIDYVLCQNEQSLMYIVNLGCIEINPWFSRVQNLENPDFVVIDLDPDGNDFDQVIEIAHEVHELLDEVGAASYCKTSGATGLHIGLPTQARYSFDEGRELAELVCKIIAKKFPSLTSVDRNPQRRRQKIYLDFLQNRRGQTLAAPFCVRPRPGAPVSMPLSWKELKKGLRPEDFHIKNALKYIPKQEAYWKPVLGPPIDLKKTLQALKKMLK